MATFTSATMEIEHIFPDHGSVAEEEKNSTEVSAIHQPGTAVSSATSTSSNLNFPAKLHYMLSELEKEGLEHIVSWQPHGRCFIIHKQSQFLEQLTW
jgi:hypothetical protein